MRNRRGVTLLVVIILLVLLALLIATCIALYNRPAPPGQPIAGIMVGATPTTLVPGGTTTAVITVTLAGPAAAPGQTVFVRVLEADYFGDDLLYRMQPVFVPFGSTVGVAPIVLECDATDLSLRAPLGSGQNDFSENESPWELRVIPYYGLYPQSADVPLTCTGG